MIVTALIARSVDMVTVLVAMVIIRMREVLIAVAVVTLFVGVVNVMMIGMVGEGHNVNTFCYEEECFRTPTRNHIFVETNSKHIIYTGKSNTLSSVK